MGTLTVSEKCARRASDGAWIWGEKSGYDYVDNDSSNYYCVVYKCALTYDSSLEYITDLTANVNIKAAGNVATITGTKIHCYLYTEDPTGGSTLPTSNYHLNRTTDLSLAGQTFSFAFTSRAFKQTSLYLAITVDKPASYGVGAHATANSGTASFSGTFVTATEQTYSTIDLIAGTGIASVSGGGTKENPAEFNLDCVPQTGYVFYGWYQNGTWLTDEKPLFVTSTTGIADITLEARAILGNYKVTLTAGDYVEGVNGDGYYSGAEEVSVSAVMQDPQGTVEYVFDRWEDASTSAVVSRSNPYTFTIGSNVSLKAYGKAQSRGTVRIRDGNTYKTAVPYIHDGITWQRAVPYVYDGSWKLST